MDSDAAPPTWGAVSDGSKSQTPAVVQHFRRRSSSYGATSHDAIALAVALGKTGAGEKRRKIDIDLKAAVAHGVLA